MTRFALLLTPFVLLSLLYDAIDGALKPYEAGFFHWEGLSEKDARTGLGCGSFCL